MFLLGVTVAVGSIVFCVNMTTNEEKQQVASHNGTTILVTSVSQAQRKTPPQDLSNVGFGSVFTDHMFTMEWTSEKGWHNAQIKPYQSFSCDPAMSSLHYGCEIFEGMKAYKMADDNVVLFRPRENLERMNKSAQRMCMPEIDVEFVLQALKLLVKQDERWVPQDKGTSLYIRPTMIATENNLSAKSSDRFMFYIILSPVGAYFKEGFKPTPIMVSETYTRASIGGVGAVKTGGNYAASMLAQKEAKEKGFAQVMWLDSLERRYVEEVGSMNIFFVINGEIVTPELTGTILSGITRKSVLELGKSWGYTMVERRISIDEVVKALEDGSCTEIFGTGTAAVIAPVGKLAYRDKTYMVNDNITGPVAKRFFDELTELQRGETPDVFGWVEHVH